MREKNARRAETRPRKCMQVCCFKVLGKKERHNVSLINNLADNAEALTSLKDARSVTAEALAFENATR